MILALTLLCQSGLGTEPRLIEAYDPSADRVALQAVIRMPPLDSRSRPAASALVRAFEGDNALFSRSEMQAICVPGRGPTAWLMPDHIGIALSVTPEDLGTGMRMLAGILTQPRFDSQQISDMKATEPYRTFSPWRLALDSQPRNWALVDVRDVAELHASICRKENIVASAAGSFAQGAARSKWVDALKDWKVGRPPRIRPGWAGTPPPASAGAPVLELRGPEWGASTPNVERKLLALIALGSGKGSSLFRIARMTHGWSYRQQALMWPTVTGWQPRLMMQSAGDNNEASHRGKLEKLRLELMKDVEAWTEDSRARAVGFARAMLTRGADLSPLHFTPLGPPGGTLEGLVFHLAYWPMKTGHDWDSLRLATPLSEVSLEELKAEALGLVKDSVPAVTDPATR